MSRENVELVRTMYADYAQGNVQAALQAYAEDTVWDDTRYRPDGAVHVGRDALVDLVQTWRGTWENYEFEAEDVIDGPDDCVVVLLREAGRGKGGGVEMTNRWGQIVTVQDALITHTVVYRAPEEAVEAAELSE